MTTTIRLNDHLAHRLTEMAGSQPIGRFVESLVIMLLEDFVENVRFEGRLPVVAVPPDVVQVTTEEVLRLSDRRGYGDVTDHRASAGASRGDVN
jgi:hypothetical protein